MGYAPPKEEVASAPLITSNLSQPKFLATNDKSNEIDVSILELTEE